MTRHTSIFGQSRRGIITYNIALTSSLLLLSALLRTSDIRDLCYKWGNLKTSLHSRSCKAAIVPFNNLGEFTHSMKVTFNEVIIVVYVESCRNEGKTTKEIW